MNGPPSQPEIKPNQTASAGFHLLKQACLHLLLTPNPHSGLCHLCRVSLFFLPLSQPPPLHPSFASSFGPIDQSTLITWLLSSLLFFYFYTLLTPFIQSQHAHSISFARPPDSLFSNSLQERRPLTSKERSKTLANTIFISSNLHVTFADVSSFDFDLKILVYILRWLNLRQEFR